MPAGRGRQERVRPARCRGGAAAVAAAVSLLALLALLGAQSAAATSASPPASRSDGDASAEPLWPTAGNAAPCQRVFARNETFPPLMYLKLYKCVLGAASVCGCLQVQGTDRSLASFEV